LKNEFQPSRFLVLTKEVSLRTLLLMMDYMDGWMDGQMDEWIDKKLMAGYKMLRKSFIKINKNI
jgi:hypothetical protein